MITMIIQIILSVFIVLFSLVSPTPSFCCDGDDILFDSSVNWDVSQRQLQTKSQLEENEAKFFRQWQGDPASLYQALLERRKEEEKSFRFPEMLISIVRMQEGLQSHLSEATRLHCLTEKELFSLRRFVDAFTSLIERDAPYIESTRIIYAYLVCMDQIFKRLCPALPYSIAKMMTEENFTNLANEPNLFIFKFLKAVSQFIPNLLPFLGPISIRKIVHIPPPAGSCMFCIVMSKSPPNFNFITIYFDLCFLWSLKRGIIH